MRHVRYLSLVAILFALWPSMLYAEAPQWFATPYQYHDNEGPGTLTFTPLGSDSTRLSFQPMGVSLAQNGVMYKGSGVYHSFPDDQANLPPVALVSFTLLNAGGQSFFFQGAISAPAPAAVTVPNQPVVYTITGTYFAVLTPQTAASWSASAQPQSNFSVTNSTPTLVDYWATQSFSEAIGGTFSSTFNASQTPVSTATWTGSVPMAGRYLVEVFIPRQTLAGAVPRTGHAVYTLSQFGSNPQPALAKSAAISQQVSSSQWVSLGTFAFSQGYRIQLTDATGEPAQTRSVVANAVRLTLTGP